MQLIDNRVALVIFGANNMLESAVIRADIRRIFHVPSVRLIAAGLCLQLYDMRFAEMQ